MKEKAIRFSTLSKEEKIQWIASKNFHNPEEAIEIIKSCWNTDAKTQARYDDFIENTITNFYLPLGVAPNFIINGRDFTIPMAIEESSVVAAVAKSAKFWATRGGFKASVWGVEKIGQVHFIFNGEYSKLEEFFIKIKPLFIERTASITKNMDSRGGGITEVLLRNKTKLMPNYYQLQASFNTKDSMGANFINSCLEQFAIVLKEEAQKHTAFSEDEKDVQVIMSILSNYVPNCLVRAEVSCAVADLEDKDIVNPKEFATRFIQAINIAEIEPYRAVTHNKGIMNGIDAVVLATGNDFRAVEAGVHAFASRSGRYSSLSHAKIENDIFSFWLEIPLSLGTVGGLTSLHPIAKLSLEMLGTPNSEELMKIVAVAGLAQNFAAIRSLITTGIQQGHMKMHLNNILKSFNATESEIEKAKDYFRNIPVTHSAVEEFLRNYKL